MASTIYDLPNDIINLIFWDHLGIQDISNCLQTSKLFHQLDGAKLNIFKNACKGYIYCVKNGLLDSMKFLYEKNYSNDYTSDLARSRAHDIIKFNGYSKYELYISNNYNIFNPIIKKKDYRIFNNKQHVEEYVNNDSFDYYNDGFYGISFYNYLLQLSCCSSNLQVTEWIYSNIIKKFHIISIYDLGYLFELSCEFGHLETSKWLYNIFIKKQKSIANNAINSFVLSCKYGHFETSKWLWQLKNDYGFSIDAKYLYKAFCCSCKYGNLEISKWIYKLIIQTYKTFTISDYDSLLESTCHYGHLETSKWLSELNIDIGKN